MEKLTASPKTIFVDQGQTTGSSMIRYEKEKKDALYTRRDGLQWRLFDVSTLPPADPDNPDEYHWSGQFPIELRPGGIFEVRIYSEDFGPNSTDPDLRAELTVYGLWARPQNRNLILDQNRETGGTYHWHRLYTNVPTRLFTMLVGRNPHALDADGLPIPNKEDLVYTDPVNLGVDHKVDFTPLLAGHRYFFTAMVSDWFGNWQVVQNEELYTLNRKLTVEFIKLHIYNDGDPFGHGKAKFYFQVMEENEIVQSFHLPYIDIDDWGETDRPYSIYFKYSGVPKPVESPFVFVRAMGTEEDGWLEADETAGLAFKQLATPAGRNVETVNNSLYLLDCPPNSVDDDFHFGVEVRWSVEYLP